MLDINLKIVASRTLTVNGGTPNTSPNFVLGRGGLPEDTDFTVVLEDPTIAAVGLVTFDFQVSVDGGTTYRRVATANIADASKKQVVAVPVGRHDIRPETFAAANIMVRVVATWTTQVSADDMIYSAYLAGPQPFKGN